MYGAKRCDLSHERRSNISFIVYLKDIVNFRSERTRVICDINLNAISPRIDYDKLFITYFNTCAFIWIKISWSQAGQVNYRLSKKYQ